MTFSIITTDAIPISIRITNDELILSLLQTNGFSRGRNSGWMAIGIPPDDCGLDKEPFQAGNMLIDMIADTQQADSITYYDEDGGGATRS